MTNIAKLENGFFYNCPDDGCIKELYYNKMENKYCVASYLYTKIIDIHNISITDDEFVSRLKMYPDNVLEFECGTNGFSRIQSMLDNNTIMPDFIGMIRYNLYSIATSNLCDKRCEDCLHFGQCEAVKMHELVTTDSCYAKDCGLFLDKDIVYSLRTIQTLRVYFANEIAKFSNFDDFVTYCKNCNISRELLKSLDINYIVFVNNKNTLYRNGNAQVYKTEKKAKEYIDSIVRVKREESVHFGKTNSFQVENDNSTTITSYESTLGLNKSYIQLVSI